MLKFLKIRLSKSANGNRPDEIGQMCNHLGRYGENVYLNHLSQVEVFSFRNG